MLVELIFRSIQTMFFLFANFFLFSDQKFYKKIKSDYSSCVISQDLYGTNSYQVFKGARARDSYIADIGGKWEESFECSADQGGHLIL